MRHFHGLEKQPNILKNIKYVMCTSHVLTMPNFTKIFIMECDASGHIIGAILMHKGTPITFFQLKGKNSFKFI